MIQFRHSDPRLRACLLLCLSLSLVAQDKPAMITRKFQVPDNFVRSLNEVSSIPVPLPDPFASTPPAAQGDPKAAHAPAKDPFATPSAQPFDPFAGTSTATASSRVQLSELPLAVAILKQAGFEFPEGASAIFDPVTSELSVTHTESCLNAINEWVETLSTSAPRRVECITCIIEVPSARAATLMAESYTTSSHREMLEALIEEACRADSDVRVVDINRVTCANGTLSTSHSISDFYWPNTLTVTPANVPVWLDLQMRPYGTHLELDPIIWADHNGVDVNLAPELVAHPRLASMPCPLPNKGQTLQAEFPAFVSRKQNLSLSFRQGSIRLVACDAPADPDDDRHRWLRFIGTSLSSATNGGVELKSPPPDKSRRTVALPVKASLKLHLAPPLGGLVPETLEQIVQRHLGGESLDGTAGADERGRLLVTCDTKNLEWVNALVSAIREQARQDGDPWDLSVQSPQRLIIQTIRAPAATMLKILKETGDNHASALTRLQAAVRQNQATMIDASLIEQAPSDKPRILPTEFSLFDSDTEKKKETPQPAPPSSRIAKLSSQTTEPVLTGISAGTDKDPAIPSIENLNKGRLIEMTIDDRSNNGSLPLVIEFAPEPFHYRSNRVSAPGADALASVPMPSSSTTKLVTSLFIGNGETRLLQVISGPRIPDHTCMADATFATFYIDQLPPFPSDRRGPPPSSVKSSKPPFESPDKDGMSTHSFSISSAFWVTASHHQAGSNDPFAPAAMRAEKKQSARDPVAVLKAAHIEFPPGASASFDKERWRLTVKNTPANLELIQRHLDRIGDADPKILQFTVNIFEAPADLIFDTLSKLGPGAEEQPVLDKLTKTPSRWIAAHRLETSSGRRASSEAVEETHSQSPPTAPVVLTTPSSPDAGKEPTNQSFPVTATTPTSNQETQNHGMFLEIDPTLHYNSSYVSLDLNLEYDTSSPEPVDLSYTNLPSGDVMTVRQWRRHSMVYRTNTGIVPGTTRLIAVWKPTGKPVEGRNVLQFATLHCSVLTP
ncbi:MAG: hypothetical protein JNM99_05475 [Verrucomicrobiaceae bacterium]|nr:hypothetical protein [Verrucomicrobiaceae bacterium]